MRTDLELICDWVPQGAHIPASPAATAFCWSGWPKRKATGYGLEIDPDGITQCVARGVNVIEHNLDDGLSSFCDSYDEVIMTQALRALRRPDKMLDEMLRVAEEGIITFPNFAYWRHHLGLRGYMPVSKSLPHAWYGTISTSRRLTTSTSMHKKGLIVDRAVGVGDHKGHWTSKWYPNLVGEIAIFRGADAPNRTYLTQRRHAMAIATLRRLLLTLHGDAAQRHPGSGRADGASGRVRNPLQRH